MMAPLKKVLFHLEDVMNKKNIARIGIVGVVLFGMTECTMIATPALAEFIEPKSQTLVMPKVLNIVDVVQQDAKFKRLDVDIVEVAPWLKPENQSITLSDTELIGILKSVGFEGHGLKMAWAIVKAESTMRPYAHNDNPRTGDNSYGLFQINMYRSLEASRQEAYGLENNEELFDPYTNAAIAFKISKGGTSWGAWTTWKKAQAIVGQFPG